MNKNRVSLNEKRLLSVAEFQVYASVGRNRAFKLIKQTGCEIRLGKRVYADRICFDQWCSRQTFQN